MANTNNNRSAKLFLSVFILLVFTREGFNALRETGNVWIPVIAVIVATVLCTLLVRSAYRKKDVVLIESRANSYFWGALKFISIVGILGVITRLFVPEPARSVIEIKGMKIPLDACIAGTAEMIPDLKQRTDYCSCIAVKLASSDSIFRNEVSSLRSGDFMTIINTLQKQGKLVGLELESCMNLSSAAVWTENLKTTIKEQLMKQHRGTDLEITNDLDKYSSCIIEHLVKYPAADVLSGRHLLTNEFIQADSLCKFNTTK